MTVHDDPATIDKEEADRSETGYTTDSVIDTNCCKKCNSRICVELMSLVCPPVETKQIKDFWLCSDCLRRFWEMD